MIVFESSDEPGEVTTLKGDERTTNGNTCVLWFRLSRLCNVSVLACNSMLNPKPLRQTMNMQRVNCSAKYNTIVSKRTCNRNIYNKPYTRTLAIEQVYSAESYMVVPTNGV